MAVIAIMALAWPTGPAAAQAPVAPAPAAITFMDVSLCGSSATCRLVLPAGSSKVAIADGVLSYVLPPPEEPTEGDSSASLRLDVTPQIMAALSKSYGYEEFPELWVARAVFENTGKRKLAAYRVRFRIPRFAGDWSAWSDCSEVVPGQTAVNVFCPLFEMEKMAQVNGTRRTAVEMECEYTAGGKVVRKSSSKTIEILGRNEVFLDDAHEELVLASLVTRDDPVVQRVAAMVSSQVPGGISAAQKSERKTDAAGNPIQGFDRNQGAKRFMRE